MFKRSLICLSVLTFFPLTSIFAAEGSNLPFELFNRLRVEYDDNIRQTKGGEDSSVKIIEDVELIFNTQQNNTFLGLRYNPSFTYWDDREEDDTDIHHQLDFSLNQDFSERLRVSLKDVFRLAELPELIESGVVSRQKNDYVYNSILGNVSLKVTDSLSLSGNARYITLAYDEDAVADTSDYDKLVLGSDLSVTVSSQLQAGLQFRYSDVEYDANTRNSESTQFGAMVNATLSPQLQVNLRGGIETKDFEDANTDSSDSPYVSGSMVFTASDALQFNAGGSYSFADTSFAPFVNQERTAIFGGAVLKLSSRVRANLGVSYAMSSFDADDTASGTDLTTVSDGDEELLRLSAQVTYEVNRSNWLELGWQNTDLSSDIRKSQEFSRNRAHVGWKLKI